MRVQIINPELESRAQALGHQIDTDRPEAVVISVTPWVAVTPEVWAMIEEAIARRWSHDHSQKIRASGKAGRPRAQHDPRVLKRAVEAYGSVHAAAKALKIHPRVFKRYREEMEACE